MKKIILGLLVLAIFAITSCTVRTCPTYAKAPVDQAIQKDING